MVPATTWGHMEKAEPWDPPRTCQLRHPGQNRGILSEQARRLCGLRAEGCACPRVPMGSLGPLGTSCQQTQGQTRGVCPLHPTVPGGASQPSALAPSADIGASRIAWRIRWQTSSAKGQVANVLGGDSRVISPPPLLDAAFIVGKQLHTLCRGMSVAACP